LGNYTSELTDNSPRVYNLINDKDVHRMKHKEDES